MSVRSAQAITVDFTTSTPSTGALTSADSTPTGTLVVNGTDNGASVTVTNKATGRYKAAVTLPTLSIGDEVQLYVAATVGGIAGGGVVWGDKADMALNSSGQTTVGTLASAVQGVVDQILSGYNVVLHVSTSGNNTTGDGSVGAPYLTIAKAISVASAYTLIRVGPGQFDEVTTSLVLPTDVSLKGAGRDVTTILSQVVSTGLSGVIVKPGTRSLVADLTIQGNAASGVSQVPLGCESFDPGFTNARFERLRLIADADGIYISGSVSSFVAEDVQIDTNYDCLAFFSPVTCTLRRVSARALGPSSISSGVTARALNNQSASSVINVYDSSFLAQDATTTTTGIENAVGGTIRLFGNTSVRSSSSTGTVKDIISGNNVAAAGSVVYDSSASKVTGTITVAGAAAYDHGRVLNPTATVGLTNTTVGTATALGSAYDAAKTALAPTVAGRTLDVAATGEAGLDFNNINDAAGAHTLTNIRVPNVTLADTTTAISSTGIDAIFNTSAAGYSTAGTLGNKLKQLTFTTTNLVDATGSSTVGSGAFTITVTVNDGSSALQNATVRYTEGANTYSAVTNSGGQCTFNLNAATYTVAITKSGYSFSGTTHTVTVTAARTYSMTQTVISAPALPTQSTGVLTTLDGQGNAVSGKVVSFKMTAGPGTTGLTYQQEFSLTSSGTSAGNLSGAFVKGATYQGWRGTQGLKRYSFTVPNSGSSFNLPEILGLDLE